MSVGWHKNTWCPGSRWIQRTQQGGLVDRWMDEVKKRIIFSCWAKHNKAVSMNKLSQMSICLIASSANSMPSVTRRSVMLTQVPSKLE